MNATHQATPDRKRQKSATLLSALTVLSIFLSGCVVNSEDPPQEGQPDEGALTPEPGADGGDEDGAQDPLASTISSSTALGSDLQIDIYTLERVSPDLLRLQFGVTNKSSSNFILNFGLTVDDKPNTASRVTLIDAQNQKRMLSYEQSDGSCFCSSWNGTNSSGSTEHMWVAFPAPVSDDVESLTVTTPLTPPLMDIPITESSETIENSGLAEPEILDLTLISDNTEDQTGRTENSEEVSILLSSDVLFETQSSDLSTDSREILQQVATEIDDASATVVQIDGYADNTGSDSVNIPLSQDRAEEVESALSDLVTRDGVTFSVEGHGSSDPIADNNTEEGRERNRRVSVTFEK